MKRRAVLALAIGFLLGADPPKEDVVKRDLGKLQGTWELVSTYNLIYDASTPMTSDASTQSGTNWVPEGTQKLTLHQIQRLLLIGLDHGVGFHGPVRPAPQHRVHVDVHLPAVLVKRLSQTLA